MTTQAATDDLASQLWTFFEEQCKLDHLIVCLPENPPFRHLASMLFWKRLAIRKLETQFGAACALAAYLDGRITADELQAAFDSRGGRPPWPEKRENIQRQLLAHGEHYAKGCKQTMEDRDDAAL